MNLLQIVNRLRVECGAGAASTPLTTVQGLSGENQRFVQWARSAWMDIATSKEDWQFFLRDFEFNTIAQQQTYTPAQVGIAETFGSWKRDSFRAATAGNNYLDEQLLNYLEYPAFRNLYQYANMRSVYARPVAYSITPERNLVLGPIPQQAYTIVGQYYLRPVDLTADTDAPPAAFFERFHMAIVYRAMMFYGGFEAASEVYSRGETEFKRLMSRIEIEYMPGMTAGAPLA